MKMVSHHFDLKKKVYIFVGVKHLKTKKIMAKTAGGYESKNKTTRPGVHSKTKTSGNKNSKNYKKSYKGQGR